MPLTPARAAAFEILLRVETEQAYASELLHSARTSELSPADHRLATELVMGVLRWRSLLDRRLQAASSQKLERLDSEVLSALRLGAYQLGFLSRVPSRAAIFESVELVKSARKRSAAPFVNAVLRKIADTNWPDVLAGIRHATDATTLAARSAHPEWLVARWIELYGLETARQVCLHDQTIPTTAIHTHLPDDYQRVAAELAQTGIQLSGGLLLSSARRVASGDITRTPAYREGRVAIQDEASQLVAMLVGRGKKILDCCAAPGSKASLIASRNPEAAVVASELHIHRARLLRGLVRQPNVRIVAADARNLPFRPQFDRVLADVPCSGTGTLARNPEIKWRLKRQDLDDLQARQIAILQSAIAQLIPGGRAIYSTCSLEPEENEAVVEAVLASASGLRIADCRTALEQLQTAELSWKDPQALLAGPYLRTIPGIHPGDGFFAAIIERIP